MVRDQATPKHLAELVAKLITLTKSCQIHWERQIGSAHRYASWKNNLFILGPAESLDAPVSLHILTGHSYNKDKTRKGVERYRGSVNLKLMDIANALFDLVFSGVLEKHPKLKVVSVENEVGWMPWIFQQWDYYYNRFKKENPPAFSRNPSSFVKEQIFSCFFNDHVCGENLAFWGQDNVMWSNDFPHPNSTWPNSIKIIQRDLGHLPPDIQ